MSDLDNLIVAQALYKELGKAVSTSTPGNLRSRVDDFFASEHERTGARTFDLKLNDELVGTYTRRKANKKRAKTENYLNIVNVAQLKAWLVDVTDIELREYVIDRLDDFARYKWEHDGEIPYGCTVETIDIDETPETYTGMMKIDTKAVADAMRQQLPPVILGLLEGGNDES